MASRTTKNNITIIKNGFDETKFRNSQAFFGRTKHSKKCPATLYGKPIKFEYIYNILSKAGGFEKVSMDAKWNELYRNSEYLNPKEKNLNHGGKTFLNCANRIKMFLEEEEEHFDEEDEEEESTEVNFNTRLAPNSSSSQIDAIHPVSNTTEKPVMLTLEQMQSKLKGQLELIRESHPFHRALSEIISKLGELTGSLAHPEVSDVVLLGPTGVGKSYFINIVLRITVLEQEEYERGEGDLRTFDNSGDAEDEEDRTWSECNLEKLSADSLPKSIQVLPCDIAADVIQQEAAALDALQCYCSPDGREEFLRRKNINIRALASPTKFAERFLTPFVLPTANKHDNHATTSHNLIIRYGSEWSCSVEYYTEAELRLKLGTWNFREPETESEKEIERMRGLLETCTVPRFSASESSSSAPLKKFRSTSELKFPVFYDSKMEDFDAAQVGEDIVFVDEIKRAAGRVIWFRTTGKDITGDRIHIRRMINGILFYGLASCDRWPDLRSTDDIKPSYPSADTAIIKSVTLYVPSRLLKRHLVLKDAPGSNDANPQRYCLLRDALTDSSGILVLTNKDNLESDKDGYEIFDKEIASRFFTERCPRVGIFALNEASKPEDVESIILEKTHLQKGIPLLDQSATGLIANDKRIAEEMQKNSKLDEKAITKIEETAAHMFEGKSRYIYPLLYASLWANTNKSTPSEQQKDAMDLTSMQKVFDFLKEFVNDSNRLEVLSEVDRSLSSLVNSFKEGPAVSPPGRTRISAQEWNSSKQSFSSTWDKCVPQAKFIRNGQEDLQNDFKKSLSSYYGQILTFVEAAFDGRLVKIQMPQVKTLESAFSRTPSAQARRTLGFQDKYFRDINKLPIQIEARFNLYRRSLLAQLRGFLRGSKLLNSLTDPNMKNLFVEFVDKNISEDGDSPLIAELYGLFTLTDLKKKITNDLEKLFFRKFDSVFHNQLHRLKNRNAFRGMIVDKFHPAFVQEVPETIKNSIMGFFDTAFIQLLTKLEIKSVFLKFFSTSQRFHSKQAVELVNILSEVLKSSQDVSKQLKNTLRKEFDEF
jgi:hypothetical protein